VTNLSSPCAKTQRPSWVLSISKRETQKDKPPCGALGGLDGTATRRYDDRGVIPMAECITQKEKRQEYNSGALPFFLYQLEPLLQELLEKLSWLCLEMNQRIPLIEDRLMHLEDFMATLDDIQRLEAQIKDLKRMVENIEKPLPEPISKPKSEIPKPEGYV